MKFIIFLLLGFYTSLFAYSSDDIMQDYTNGNYKKVCINSASFYKNGGKNEKLLTIIGDACSRIDYINPLGYVVRGLISTPKFRENGSYFATLVLQKKLIYQFMNDGINLQNLRLPRSEHTLSIVFENLVKKNYKIKEKTMIIKLENKEYKVWLGNEEKKIVHVDEYNNGKLIKKHEYL